MPIAIIFNLGKFVNFLELKMFILSLPVGRYLKGLGKLNNID